jgi:hypothetical protein
LAQLSFTNRAVFSRKQLHEQLHEQGSYVFAAASPIELFFSRKQLHEQLHE